MQKAKIHCKSGSWIRLEPAGLKSQSTRDKTQQLAETFNLLTKL